MDESPDTGPPPALRRKAYLLAIAMTATLVALVGLGVTAAFTASADRSPHAAPQMFDVSPAGIIAPADVPPAVAVHYRTALRHPEVFADVPCFCGCEAMLGHRHLLDCFARPDGRWEAHAVGCGVCLGEADQIGRLLAGGETDPRTIRAAVVDLWGDPYLAR